MRHSFIRCAILIILLSPAALVHADSPAPEYDYVVAVGDAGEYVFVMLAVPDDRTAYGQAGWIEEDEEIRAKYRVSGLYRSGETEAIWTVDWYAFRVDITPDGKHLVRWGPWAFTPNYNEIALEFYENGELLRSYRVSNLVVEPERLPQTVSHYFWVAEAEVKGEKRDLYLRTENGEEYVFDVTTGEIISESKPATPQATPTPTAAQAAPTPTAAQAAPTPTAAQAAQSPAAVLLPVVIIGAIVLGLVLGYFVRRQTKAS